MCVCVCVCIGACARKERGRVVYDGRGNQDGRETFNKRKIQNTCQKRLADERREKERSDHTEKQESCSWFCRHSSKQEIVYNSPLQALRCRRVYTTSAREPTPPKLSSDEALSIDKLPPLEDRLRSLEVLPPDTHTLTHTHTHTYDFQYRQNTSNWVRWLFTVACGFGAVYVFFPHEVHKAVRKVFSSFAIRILKKSASKSTAFFQSCLFLSRHRLVGICEFGDPRI